MRIAMGADHAGYELKEAVKGLLEAAGHEVTDVGTHSAGSVDYPPFAAEAASLVAGGGADRGVIVCGSGNGVAIVANKIHGIRAVNAHDVAEAEMARRHNDINVLTLSGQRLTADEAGPIVDEFLKEGFEGGRHERRVNEITEVERTSS
ncbi:MAG: ribose 5-phosphate isomerase B [Solirubrobacterales bacterium]|nr:ribose 5-phosphate isomerase B [Solirubrobacterales bacterium]